MDNLNEIAQRLLDIRKERDELEARIEELKKEKTELVQIVKEKLDEGLQTTDDFNAYLAYEEIEKPVGTVAWKRYYKELYETVNPDKKFKDEEKRLNEARKKKLSYVVRVHSRVEKNKDDSDKVLITETIFPKTDK